MRWLPDSNILLRSAQATHPMHEDATRAISALLDRGDEVLMVTQNLTEFWSVATRPTTRNGLGLTTAEADHEVRRLLGLLPLLPESERVFPEWLHLVRVYEVTGVQVYDARLAACVFAHQSDGILTFNVADFRRYTALRVLHPDDVLMGRL